MDSDDKTNIRTEEMKLLVVIPALNEEESISSTIEQTLASREIILSQTPVTEVAITVVSDGSTDRTPELARAFGGRIKLIEFPENRGYGAAIKEAWRQSDADLLSFLDADGTCNPRFFADLCNRLIQQDLDVVCGSRLHAGSRMQLIRRIGNTIFAILVTVFSSARVRDTASGMRVVRRSSLSKLYPLPNGLHFTPAMSARALLSQGVRIGELDMPYQDRIGRSKLNVGRDGLRFLKVILDTAFLYRPARPLAILGVACLGVSCSLMIMPTLYYLDHHSVLEWMIYRFVVSQLTGVTAFLLLSASYLTDRMVQIVLSESPSNESSQNRIGRFLSRRVFWLVPMSLVLIGVILVMPSFLELVRTGSTYEHWSRFIAMSFVVSLAVVLVVTLAIDYVLDLITAQVAYSRSQESQL